MQGVVLQVGQGNHFERALMSGLEHHWRRNAGLGSLTPSTRTDTPSIARLEAGEAKLGARRHEVIAMINGEIQKHVGHHRAHSVTTKILSAGMTAAVAEKAREGVKATGLELATEDVFGLRGRHASSLGEFA